MVLEFSETMRQECSKSNGHQAYNQDELNERMFRLMDNCGISRESLDFKDANTVELKDTSRLKLHKFMLEAEKLGLDWNFTKKTYIEFC